MKTPPFFAALSCFAFPPLGGDASAAVLSDAGAEWELRSDEAWLTVSAPETANGITSWKISVPKNPKGHLQASLSLLYQASTVQTFAVYQAGGDWVEFQVEMVLQPPASSERGEFPLVMELGIAGKFIAQQLQKLPPPAKAAGLAATLALVEAVTAAAIAARAALANVPEPPDFFKAPPQIPMTQQLITQQGELLSAYIVQETLGG